MASHTDIVKVPLVFLNIVCTQVALTSPTPPPHRAEQRKYDSVKGEKGAITMLNAVAVMKPLVHILNLMQLLAMVVTTYPHLLDLLQFPPLWSNILRRTLVVPGFGLTTSFLCGCALVYLGTLIRYTAYRYLGHLFTFQLAVRKEHKLITGGPYAIVRHPSYTGGIFFIIGTTICQLGFGSYWLESGMETSPAGMLVAALYVAVMVYIGVAAVWRTAQEDVILRAEFGEQWDVWAKKTQYKLLPYVF